MATAAQVGHLRRKYFKIRDGSSPTAAGDIAPSMIRGDTDRPHYLSVTVAYRARPPWRPLGNSLGIVEITHSPNPTLALRATGRQRLSLSVCILPEFRMPNSSTWASAWSHACRMAGQSCSEQLHNFNGSYKNAEGYTTQYLVGWCSSERAARLWLLTALALASPSALREAFGSWPSSGSARPPTPVFPLAMSAFTT